MKKLFVTAVFWSIRPQPDGEDRRRHVVTPETRLIDPPTLTNLGSSGLFPGDENRNARARCPTGRKARATETAMPLLAVGGEHIYWGRARPTITSERHRPTCSRQHIGFWNRDA